MRRPFATLIRIPVATAPAMYITTLWLMLGSAVRTIHSLNLLVIGEIRLGFIHGDHGVIFALQTVST